MNAAQPIRFGYKASAEQFAPSELLEYGVLAEKNGFDSLFVSDHLQPWNHEGGHAPAAMPWLGALGASTERIIMGTSVLTPSFRYHPGVVAQAFGTLGAMFPGRVILGVGSGEALNEVALGFEWPDMKERFARLKEAIQLIEKLWSEDEVTFDGQFFRTQGATIYDRPETPVPIYIGASGPAATRLAGRIASGFITTSGKARELYTDTLLPALAEGIEKGRPRRGRGRHPDGDEGVVRPRPRACPAGHPVLGAARPHAGGEDDRAQPGRDAAPRRRTADRAGGLALDRVDRTPTSTSRASRSTSTWASGTWCSTGRGRTRSASSSCTGARFFRGCGLSCRAVLVAGGAGLRSALPGLAGPCPASRDM